MKPSERHLANYLALLGKVDELCHRITSELAPFISCGKGCDGCCRHLSLFPVEAAALAYELSRLPSEMQEMIKTKARTALPDEACPLLENGLCLLYHARPIICRTHGLPILSHDGKTRIIDFCPLNFKDVQSLPGTVVIDLEVLNSSLAAVNSHFLAYIPETSGEERVRVAAALLSV